MLKDPLGRFVLKIALIIGIVLILYYGRKLFIPLAIAGLLAMLFNPMQNALERHGWARKWSVTACTIVLLLIFGGLFFGLGQQVANFADQWPKIKRQAVEKLEQVHSQIAGEEAAASTQNATNSADAEGQNNASGNQQQPADSSSSTGGNPEQSTQGGGSSGSSGGLALDQMSQQQVSQILNTILTTIGDFLLMIVYFILLLAQKDRLYEFALRRAGAGRDRAETKQTLDQSTQVAHEYLKGRLILIAILAVAYGIGFSVLGLQYALFIAVFASVLTIIPYLGNIIGGVLALGIAVISGGDTTQLLGVIGIMSVAQLLESYILEPLIVGRSVDINPLFTIIFVVAFTLIWGPIGAIVAIPIGGILRIVFKHIDGMQDYAFLIEEENK